MTKDWVTKWRHLQHKRMVQFALIEFYCRFYNPPSYEGKRELVRNKFFLRMDDLWQSLQGKTREKLSEPDRYDQDYQRLLDTEFCKVIRSDTCYAKVKHLLVP